MKILVLLACVLCASALPAERIDGKDVPMSRIPRADGMLHIYTLPVGQGAARVIQCPSGKLNIFDMGTCQSQASGFWYTNDIRNFLNGNFNLITNIILTHNHFDHYSLLYQVFHNGSELSGLTKIYISRTFNEMATNIQNWINNIGAFNKVHPFNGGSICGSSGGPACGYIDLCPGDPGISTQVLSVNAGLQCTPRNTNTDSVVIAITYNLFTVQLNGDFEDCTANEDGPLFDMAYDYYQDLYSPVDVYMIAHHGAENLANKPIILDILAPKAVFVSANHDYNANFRHPRCTVLDHLINSAQSLCKPEETNTTSRFYCGAHPIPNLPLARKLQTIFTCGDPVEDLWVENDNHFAIYSTTPDSTSMNLIHLVSDGSRWGFETYITQRIVLQGFNPADEDVCSEA